MNRRSLTAAEAAPATITIGLPETSIGPASGAAPSRVKPSRVKPSRVKSSRVKSSKLQRCISASLAVFIATGGVVCIRAGLTWLGALAVTMAVGAGLRVGSMMGDGHLGLRRAGTVVLGFGSLALAAVAAMTGFIGPAIVAMVSGFFALADLAQTGDAAPEPTVAEAVLELG